MSVLAGRRRASSSCSRRSRTGSPARAAQPDDEVDAAREVSAHALAQRRVVEPLRVAGERDRRGQVREHRRDRAERHAPGRVVAAGERQLEVELVEPVAARDVAQPAAAEQRAERRLDRRGEPVDHVRRLADLDRRRACTASIRAASSAARSGAAKSAASKHAVDERADADAGRASRRAATARARSAACRSSSPATADAGAATGSSSSITCSSGSLPTCGSCVRGRDVAVGGAPPAEVEVAVERARPRASPAAGRRRPTRTRPRRTARSTEMHPRRVPASSWNRAVAAASVGVTDPAGGTLPSASRANRSRPSARVAAVPRAGPPDDRLVARARQRDVRQAQVLAALLGLVLRAVRRVVRPVHPDVDHARVVVRPGRGTRSAACRAGSSPAPTGTGSRRSGTRGPCCGGSSAPGPPRRPIRGGGCAPRRSCPRRPRRSGGAATRSARSCPSARRGPRRAAAAPRWRRSVIRRSPSASRSTRSGRPSTSVIASVSAATPRRAQDRAPTGAGGGGAAPSPPRPPPRSAPRSSRGTG